MIGHQIRGYETTCCHEPIFVLARADKHENAHDEQWPAHICPTERCAVPNRSIPKV